MPTIEVRLHAGLERYAPMGGGAAASFPLAVPDGGTVGDVLSHLGIPREAVHLIFVNGLAQSLDSPLKEGDRLALFAPIGGG